jgi:hypothetical protein
VTPAAKRRKVETGVKGKGGVAKKERKAKKP